MPSPETLDWNKVQMNSWAQYGSKVDNIRVRLNNGKSPTIEFMPSPVDGDDPYKLYGMVLYDCTKLLKGLRRQLVLKLVDLSNLHVQNMLSTILLQKQFPNILARWMWKILEKSGRRV